MKIRAAPKCLEKYQGLCGGFPGDPERRLGGECFGFSLDLDHEGGCDRIGQWNRQPPQHEAFVGLLKGHAFPNIENSH